MKSLPEVLVIDDEPTVRHAMQILLRPYCQVTTVSSGQEGIDATRTQDYDIVIIDIHMPGMCSLETLQQVKQISPDTEVLVITGNIYHQRVKDAIQLGAADCISKPVERKVLESQIVITPRRERRGFS